MYFNSYIFIFLFVPLVLAGYFFFNHKKKYRLAQAFVAGMSLWFYSYADVSLFFLIMTSLCGNYICSFLMDKTGKRKLFGVIGVMFNLTLLFYFKYYDFFISNMNELFRQSWALKHIVLPMGISFYTFQQISFIVDRQWGKAPHYSILDYVTFVTYFPQLVAGPIVRHDELVPQFQDVEKKKFDWQWFSRGITLFILGLSKKMLIADILSLAADYGFANIESLDTAGDLAADLAYTLQMFFDFSGYSDMAVGLAWMMNIDLPMNFDTPYKSRSIAEYWRRWHITLSHFFTAYVYIPMGGSRKGEARTLFNNFFIFFLSGLWHGANWTFVIWGMCHGVAVVIDRLVKTHWKGKAPGPLHRKLQTVRAFLVVMLLFVIFRSESMSDALRFYKKIFSFNWTGAIYQVVMSMDNAILYIPLTLIKRINAGWFESVYLVYYLIMVLLALVLCSGKGAYRIAKEGTLGKKRAWGIALLFCACVISLSKVVVFLYSNF